MQLGALADATLVGLLVLQTFLGWRRGLLWQAASVASIAFGILLGWVLTPLTGELMETYVTSNPFHAKMVGFLFIVGLTGFLLRMAAAWAEVRSEKGLPSQERESRRADDRILGGIFGALKGCVMALILVAAGVTIYPNAAIWQKSALAGPLATAGSRLLPDGAVAEVKRWAAESAADLKRGLDIK